MRDGVRRRAFMCCTTSPAVPTWNYAAVHVYEKPRAREEGDLAAAALQDLVARHEGSRAKPWRTEDLAGDVYEKLTKAIVAFEMPIDRIEGKFKLGQNRSQDDRLGMLQGLDAEQSPDAGALASFIRAYLDTHDYSTYATSNIELYTASVGNWAQSSVVALSSGFMTYPADIHPSYVGLRQRLVSTPSTFVLLASVDFEACAAETVRRQLARPFARTATREEQVVRDRFPTYIGLPVRKVATMWPVEAVVTDLMSALAAQHAAAPDGTGAGSRPHLALGVS